MIKYASNAFHAVKISFANEIGALCEQVGVDGHEVMATLCEDVKLNISSAYLKPGFAFGGSCLPKDLRALVYRAAHLDLKLPLLEAAMPSNEQHLRRADRGGPRFAGATDRRHWAGIQGRHRRSSRKPGGDACWNT